MRIAFLTQTDPIYILPLFEEFLRNYSEEHEVVGVFCCKTMGSRSRRQMIRELTALYGPFGFARLLIRVATSKGFGLFRRGKNATRYFSLQQVCRAYGINCTPVENPNSPSFLSNLRERDPDLLVSVACPYILKQPLLQLPRLGCINIHHAPLPRYKGMMPTFWQLYHGERTVGLTIHYMTERLDQGQALLQEQLPINPNESLDALIRRSKRHAAHCLARVLRGLASQSILTYSLDREKGSYFTFPTLAEIREFQRRGLRAI